MLSSFSCPNIERNLSLNLVDSTFTMLASPAGPRALSASSRLLTITTSLHRLLYTSSNLSRHGRSSDALQITSKRARPVASQQPASKRTLSGHGGHKSSSRHASSVSESHPGGNQRRGTSHKTPFHQPIGQHSITPHLLSIAQSTLPTTTTGYSSPWMAGPVTSTWLVTACVTNAIAPNVAIHHRVKRTSRRPSCQPV